MVGVQNHFGAMPNSTIRNINATFLELVHLVGLNINSAPVEKFSQNFLYNFSEFLYNFITFSHFLYELEHFSEIYIFF